MKKLLSILMALCLLFSCVPAVAEDDVEVFLTSDFSAGTDGWTARGKNTVLEAADGVLTVTGRGGKSEVPVLELPLEGRKLYSFSVDIQQDAKKSVEFNVTVEHKKAGIVSYTKLGSVTAPRGEKVTLTGEWASEPYDSYTLTVTPVNQPKIDFSICGLKILVSDPFHITPVTWEGELPVLKDVYAGKFDFGTCVSQADVRDARRGALVVQQYSIVTPENELKPESVLDVSASRKLVKETDDDTQVAVRFSAAKPILDFAQANGLKVHGHVLVWHSQTPEEFFHVGYDRRAGYVSRDVMLARLENYIRLIFEYMDENYPGLIVSWDVANECVADGSSSLRPSNWTRVVGSDFVARAFEYADKYAPEGVLLYYNDYSTPYEPKLTGIYNLLKSLVDEGHIDGYGFQSHYGSDTPSISEVRNAFRRIAGLGLRLRVSELDLKVTADTDLTRGVQAQKYGELMGLYLEYSDRMDAVQVWGVCDGTSWIKESFPLFFDAYLQPKPAFFSVAEAVKD